MKRICSLLLTVAMIVTFCVALWSPVSAAQFTDVRTSDYFNDAVNWAVKNGITAGTSATTFGPNVNCTRAQVVTFLYKAKDGATIIQPENDSKKAYEPIITNTVKMLKGQSYDANYVADNKHMRLDKY